MFFEFLYHNQVDITLIFQFVLWPVREYVQNTKVKSKILRVIVDMSLEKNDALLAISLSNGKVHIAHAVTLH